MGRLNTLQIFFLGSPQDDFCPIIFSRPFLNIVKAKIDCEEDIVEIGLGDMKHEFNFAKFRRQPREKELPSKDELIGLASIAVPPTDPLEQYLLDHENDLHMHERNEIDKFSLNVLCLNTMSVEKTPMEPLGSLLWLAGAGLCKEQV